MGLSKFPWVFGLSLLCAVATSSLLAACGGAHLTTNGCNYEIKIHSDGTVDHHGRTVRKDKTVDWRRDDNKFTYTIIFDGPTTPFTGNQNNFTEAQDQQCSNKVIAASSDDDADVYHYKVCINNTSNCNGSDPHVIVVGGNGGPL